jgi:hypothetical protein
MDLTFAYSLGRVTSDHVGGVTVTRVRHAASGFECFAYQCSLEEDFDGAPDAYGIDNPHPVDAAHNPDTALQHGVTGRDHICNATNPHEICDASGHDFAYVGLFAANENDARGRFSIDKRPFLEARARMGWVKHGHDMNWELIHLTPAEPGIFPAIQGAGSPAPGPGHYVSTTSAVTDPALNDWDQNKYVNALAIPYAATAGWWRSLGVNLGDFGVAIARNTGAVSGFVFADSGSGRVGEVSNRLLTTLTSAGGTNESKFNFLVFPNSGRGVAGQFTQEAVIQNQVRQKIRELNAIPGNDELLAFLAYDTDRTRFQAWSNGRRGTDTQEIAIAGQYDTMYMALSSFGYSSNGDFAA